MAIVNTIDLDALVLAHGQHNSWKDGACIMEAQERIAFRRDGQVAAGQPTWVRLWGQCVITATGCWEYGGGRNADGYGVLRVDGKTDKAHRVSWTLQRGQIPADLSVLHRCDNPPCIRPDHLFLGTLGDNNRDRQSKGRTKNLFPSGSSHPAVQRAGERHWCARLTDADVLAIRAARAAGEPNTTIAERFGVNAATISRIGRGLWRATA